MAVHLARKDGLANFSCLVSHVLVPPAIEAILSSPESRVDGFLAAGHVCTVMGIEEYRPIAARHRVPIVVTGFEPADILQGILLCVRQLEAGDKGLEESLALFEKGVNAAKELSQRLEEAKRQVEVLCKENGKLVRKPLEENDK